MDSLGSFMEADLKCRKNKGPAENVAGNAAGEEPNLTGESRAGGRNGNLKVKEMNLSHSRKGIDSCWCALGNIVNAEKTGKLLTEYREDRA